MKSLHFKRFIKFFLMALSLAGLYAISLAFLEKGTASDSHLLEKIGVPGLGIIIVGAVALTFLSEIFLVTHLDNKS
jgi:hypothetical protein